MNKHPGKRVKDPVSGVVMPDAVGMKCQACGEADISVVDSRPGIFAGNGTVRRLRKCNSCDERWVTFEFRAAALEDVRRSAAKKLIEAALGAL